MPHWADIGDTPFAVGCPAMAPLGVVSDFMVAGSLGPELEEPQEAQKSTVNPIKIGSNLEVFI
jgi:hypothetical protein